MTLSPTERKIRAAFPMIRFMQAHLPLPAAHWLLRQGIARLRLDPDVIHEPVSAAGVPCHWVKPKQGTSSHVLLYLHGGGFVFGLSPQHLQMGAWLARRMQRPVLMVDYRLAPRYPFPAALDDCTAVYHWLLSQGISSQHITVAGDSAGGNLTVTLLLRLRNTGAPLPAAAACLSPVTDLTEGGAPPDFQDPLLPQKAMRFYTKSYVRDSDAHDPLISPVFGDLRGLPPLLIHVGEDEILRSDAIRLAERAAEADVDVRMEVFPRMWHVWQLNLALPQAEQSLGAIAEFLSAR